MNVLIFGDSIALGSWDPEGGWVRRLTKPLVKKVIDSDMREDYEVYNLGIAGDTTAWLLERFEFETKTRVSQTETAIVFAVGINDSEYCHSTEQMQVPPEKFQDNLRTLISLAKKYSSQIVFIGLTPVNEAKVDPIPWSPDFSYRNELVKKYNAIIKSVCQQNSVLFIDTYDRLKKDNFERLLADGVHPNSEGHQKIWEIVAEPILALLSP